LQNTSSFIKHGLVDFDSHLFSFVLDDPATNQLFLLKNIIDSFDEFSLLSIVDTDETIVFVNKEFCKISKYSEDELLGQNHSIIKSGHHSSTFYKNMKKTIYEGHVWQGEFKNKAKDGTFYWVRTMIMPLFGTGNKIEQYIAIRTDITSQIRLAEKLVKSERLSSIGELSARLAHDIRNPLSVIKTSQKILRKLQGDPESVEQTLVRNDNAIDRIVHQIDNVMDFLKDSPLKLESVSVLEFIQLIISEMSISDEIKITLPSNDVTIQADKVKLDSLFSNIIFNAIQAIDNKGTITIRISEKPDNLVEIEIEDDGPAIPKENLKNIFDPLFTTKQVGTGLGLASCKRIVEQHGGNISVTNNPVIFKISLPIFHNK